MSETTTNSTNVTITPTINGHKFSVGTKAPIVNKHAISEEQIEEMAALLDNILQDALVICEEDCCEDQATKIDVNAISRSIVKTITQDLLLPKFDVLEYQKQIRDLEKKLKIAQNSPNNHYKESKYKTQWDNPKDKK